jgi:hypothetical protein
MVVEVFVDAKGPWSLIWTDCVGRLVFVFLTVLNCEAGGPWAALYNSHFQTQILVLLALGPSMAYLLGMQGI